VTQTWQLLRTAVLTLCWLLVLPGLLVLFSAIVPVIPWVRIYAFDVVPNRVTWFLLASLAVLVIGSFAHSSRATGVTSSLLATASITMLVAAGVLTHFLYIADTNGVRINLVDTLSTRHFSDSTGPDESRIYALPAGEPLWLDVYKPRKTAWAKRSPVLMVVHGGGFVEGTREVGAANMRTYADQGWTVISIDYRLARTDRPTWDLATRDVLCALAWTAKNADTLAIDINQLTLSGASAGGSLAIAAGYSAGTGRYDVECGSHVPRVAAVVAKAPLIDPQGSWQNPGELQGLQRSYMTRYLGGAPDQYPERYAAADVRRYLARTNPPTLILAGARDPLLPAAAVEDFTAKSTALGGRTRLVMFPYSGHAFNTTFDSVTNQTVIQVIAQFMVSHGVAPEAASTSKRDTPLLRAAARASSDRRLVGKRVGAHRYGARLDTAGRLTTPSADTQPSISGNGPDATGQTS
jgi:acetyl esterase